MTIQSLENYLRETAKIKPDVVVLPDFPVEHSLQSKVHYVTRIYTLRDKAKEVEDHVLSMQSDGEIRDPFDLTRLPPEAGFDGIVNTQAKNIERDKQLRDRLLYDANFNKGVVMCYGEDAHVIQSLLEKGHSVAYTHLDMENPLGRISTNFIDDYNEIGALVMKLGEGPKDNTKTVFVSSSDYDKLLSYKEFTETYLQQERERQSGVPSLENAVGGQSTPISFRGALNGFIRRFLHLG